MTAFTLGEAAALALGRLDRAAPARPRRAGGGAPVRRGSVEAGSFEALFFATPAKGECDRMLRAARDALDAGRRLKRRARAEGRALAGPERALAGLTAGAIRVFEELCALARINRGRVFPSYDRLARVTALGRATVARALAALEAAGFLRRQRRFVRVAGDGAGPRYAQTSNAYRPMLPAAVQRLLRTLLPGRAPAPIPADAAQHVAEQTQSVATMRAGLNCRELAQATLDGALGQALERLGAALDGRAERESHDEPEPLPQDMNHRRFGMTGTVLLAHGSGGEGRNRTTGDVFDYRRVAP